jgi:hypothetical protein
MSGHTPGPWDTQECSNGGLVLLRGKYGKHAQSHLQIVPKEDARLIAAAPDLYEACRIALDSLRAWNEMSVPREMREAVKRSYEHSPEIKGLLAALAKAEGRDL